MIEEAGKLGISAQIIGRVVTGEQAKSENT